MKALIDFLPILVFFVVYKIGGIFQAVSAMIIASLAQVLLVRVFYKRFEKNHIISFILLFIFGGITLLVRDPAFVMWKVSVIYILFAAFLLGSLWFGKKPLLQRFLENQMELPSPLWRRVTTLWGLGFIGISFINVWFVQRALEARDTFITEEGTVKTIDLILVNCSEYSAQALCRHAQAMEDQWVSFKLFGTLGLTFLLLAAMLYMVRHHLKSSTKETS